MEDRESHVYLVNGVKQYYRVYVDILVFLPKNAKYLGIAQEPIEPIRSSEWYLLNQQRKGERKHHKRMDNSGTPMPPTLEKSTIGRNSKFKIGQTCCYCEVPLTEKNYTKEHVIPKRIGGRVILACCRMCNTEKGGLMLHSYIQLLCSKDLPLGSHKYNLNQTKINNANELAKQIALHKLP